MELIFKIMDQHILYDQDGPCDVSYDEVYKCRDERQTLAMAKALAREARAYNAFRGDPRYQNCYIEVNDSYNEPLLQYGSVRAAVDIRSRESRLPIHTFFIEAYLAPGEESVA